MRGKCESCEFFELYPVGRQGTYDGVCTVRSPAGETWPKRYKVAGCGEHEEREERHGEELEACMDLINSRLGEQSHATVYLSSGVVGDMPIAWYWDANGEMGIHGPFDSRDKATADAKMLGHRVI